MKLLSFIQDASTKVGALTERGIVALADHSEHPAFASMQSLIEAGPAALDAAKEVVAKAGSFLDADAVEWLAPLPAPVQIRDCLGFKDHFENSINSTIQMRKMQSDDPEKTERELRAAGIGEIPAVWFQQPIYYKANRLATSGHDQDIVWPAYSQLMDFELEMACIIGPGGKDIDKASALRHVFGYTIFNDLSARDAQGVEMMGLLGPAKGKDFDGANVFGPVIVTADEIPDPYSLAMQARVNGETWCDGSSSTMHWRFEDMIAHISMGETLYPGEIIGSGTVGFGSGLERLKFLNSGDMVELEIEHIGILRNRVISATQPKG